MHPLPALPVLVSRWAERAQQQAIRNAMVASTALAERRAERLEVEEFLTAAARSRASRPGNSPAPAVAHG